MSNNKCLVRGSINIDEFYLVPHIVRPGETLASTGFSRRAGGKGANQAYACGRAGGQVVLDAAVGPDGRAQVAQIESGGVDVGRVREVEGEVTGRAIIQRSADGENCIVLHAGANFSPGGAPNLDGFTHLLLQNEIPLAETEAYLRLAGERGVTTVYNPSPMPTQAQLQAFPWGALTHLIVNEGELADIYTAFGGSPVDGGSVAETAKVQMRALNQSKGFNPRTVIVTTIGPDGVLFLQPAASKPSASGAAAAADADIKYFPAAKARKVVDTTGAGDTFAGYFIAVLMEKGNEAPIEQVVPTCLQACSLTIENAGAMESIPARAEVEARLAAGGV